MELENYFGGLSSSHRGRTTIAQFSFLRSSRNAGKVLLLATFPDPPKR